MTPEQQAQNWLGHLGVKPLALTKMSGYCNHVFLVEQANKAYPSRSVLRLADWSLGVGLCPLADQGEFVIAKYRDAERLDLTPPVILADSTAGVMWLEYAGAQAPLTRASFNDIRSMLSRLHSSDFGWGGGSGMVDAEKILLALSQSSTNQNQVLPGSIDHLLRLGNERGYFNRPKVPVHSDLNPGNWLHNGERWWLIDWDYAGMYPLEWDYAGLIVEHGWDEARVPELLPGFPVRDIAWFCSHFALLSWDWHCKRGTATAVRDQKLALFRYWLGRI